MVVAWLYYSVPLVLVCFLWLWYVAGVRNGFAMVLLWCYMVLLGCCCGVGDVVSLWL